MAQRNLKSVNYYDAKNPKALTEIGYVNGIRVEINLNQDVEVNEGIKEMFDYAHNAERKADRVINDGKISAVEATPRKF
jgi:hypothetical protein